tara:strand:- start:3297 stop:4199 length:903 start_codon:yes stop_codon:yes gene_type:complete
LKKKILIVGGTGFIGYHLAKESLKKKWEVTSISTRKVRKIRFLKKVKYIYCDISKKKSFKKIQNQEYDYVVNLGGYVNHRDKKKTMESHFLGCKNLSNYFLNKKILSFVQMGSSIEYGKFKSPQKENLKINSNSLKSTYGKAKLLATNYLMKQYKKNFFPVTVLRLYLAYGPKQDLNRLIPITINSCLKNKKFPCSTGVQYRDFVYIGDVVQAILNSIQNKKAKGQIINIGSGNPIKVKDIINTIKKISKGGLPQFGMIELREDEILKLYADTSKAFNILKWKPKISFEDGIKKTINSFK